MSPVYLHEEEVASGEEAVQAVGTKEEAAPSGSGAASFFAEARVSGDGLEVQGAGLLAPSPPTPPLL